MALAGGILLDTHAWVWLRFGTLEAVPETLDALRQAAEADRWFVCDFTFYEIAHAVSRKRLQLDGPIFEWFSAASVHGMPRLITITPEVAAATLDLPAEFHGDPGDRILAATAMVHNLTLCTHDRQLLRFSRRGHYRALKVNEGKP